MNFPTLTSIRKWNPLNSLRKLAVPITPGLAPRIVAIPVLVGSKRCGNTLRRRGGPPARRGIALFLVLVTVTTCVLIGVVFLSDASTGAVSSRRTQDRLNARMIAEAALAETTRYISKTSTWRTDMTNGQWFANHSLLGGTVSVWGQDGTGVDSSGNITGGDGSLSDDSTDSVIITATAVYGGSRYRARTRISQGSSSVLAADGTFTLKENAMVDSYNHLNGAYGGANQGQSAKISSNTIGGPNLSFEDKAKITGTLYLPLGGDASKAVKASPNITTYVTGGTSNLAVEGVDFPDSTVPDYTPDTSNYDYNDAQTLSSDLAANDFKISGHGVLTVTGNSNVNLFVDGKFELKDDALLILENPKYGNDSAYSSSGSNIAGTQRATQITVSETMEVRYIGAYIKKKDKNVKMAIYTDVSNAPGALVIAAAKEKITSDSYYWHESAITPTTLAPGTYWVALSFDDSACGYRYKNGGKTATRNNAACTGTYLANWGTSDSTPNESDNLYVTGNVAGKGASLTVYAAGEVDIHNDAIVNATTGKSNRFTLYHVATDVANKMDIHDKVNLTGTLVAESTTIEIHKEAVVSGLIRASTLKVKEDAVIHADISGGTAMPGILIDGNLEMKDNAMIDGIGGNAIVASNAVGKPVIWIKNNSIMKGNTYGGPDGMGGNTGFQKSSTSQLTGVALNLDSAVDLSIPSWSNGASVGDKNLSNGSTINSSYTCNKFTLKDSATVTVTGNQTIFVKSDATFNKNCKLVLAAGASLNLYLEAKLDMPETFTFNDGGDPAALKIFITSSNKFEVKKASKITAVMRAPNSEVKLKDTSQWFGSIYAKQISAEKNSQIHYDTTGVGGVTWIEGR